MAFESLTERLNGVFKKLRGKGKLNEADIKAAMREVRMALLEADVALPVVREFIARVKDKALGQEVVGSLTPGQVLVQLYVGATPLLARITERSRRVLELQVGCEVWAQVKAVALLA